MALKLPTKAAQAAESVQKPAVIEHKPKMQQQMEALQELEAQVVAAVDALAIAYKAYNDGNAKALTDAFDKTKKGLQAIAGDEFPPEQQAIYSGTEMQAIFSSKPQEYQFSVEQKMELLNKLGPQVFCHVVKIGVTDLKKIMAEAEIDKISTKGWGSRRFVGMQPL